MAAPKVQPIPDVHRDELLAAEAAYQAQRAELERAAQRRADAIRRVTASGGSRRAIGEVLGLSPARVDQLLKS